MHPKAIQKVIGILLMSDSKRFKKASVSYGMHSPIVKRILNSQATQKRNISQNQEELATTILEADPQLQWKHGGERKLGSQNNNTRVEVLKFPKTIFSVNASMLVCKDRLHLMIILWLYAVQQLCMLATGLKNQERGLSNLLILYKAQKKPSLFFFNKDSLQL